MESTAKPSYTVSARKYRPQHWDAVVGQEGITRTLKQAIDQEQVAQAYLFCGPRGVGKTTSARIFARAINGFESGEAEDYAFNVFELDAASNNKVEDIRSIVDQVRIPPQQGRYKVYIIDEVHMLSQAAFNAFLKTLEEPPPHAVFILATTEKHKILPTILSRCQIFDFHRITVPDMVVHLQGICAKEGIVAEEAALHVVAVKADGALRDALSIFDQLVAFAGTSLDYATVAEHLHVLDQQTYFDVVDAARSGDIAKSLLILDGIVARGFDPHHFVTGLGAHLRNLLVSKDVSTISLMEVTEDVKAQFAEQSSALDLRFLVRAMELVNEADIHYKNSNHQRLLVELTLMQLASLSEVEKKKPELISVAPDAWTSPVISTPQPAAPQPAASPASSVPHSASEAFIPREGEQVAADLDESVELDLDTGSPNPAPVEPTFESAIASAVAASDSPRSKRKPRVSLSAPSSLMDDPVNAPAVLPTVERSEPITAIGLDAAWTAYLNRVQSAEQLSYYTTLRASTIACTGDEVTVSVLNKLQENQIRESQLELVRFLADQLQNDRIQFRIEVVAPSESSLSNEFMNDRERYESMVQKNPQLDALRKRLDLDLLG